MIIIHVLKNTSMWFKVNANLWGNITTQNMNERTYIYIVRAGKRPDGVRDAAIDDVEKSWEVPGMGVIWDATCPESPDTFGAAES